MTIPSDDTTRRYPLDWLRIAAFALLVPYHVGMYYVSWDWHIKSPRWQLWLEPWMQMLSPWRMDLLFIVSGAATALMLHDHAPSVPWLRRRSARLLLPLLLGMLVIVPPQSYFEVQRRFGYTGSYLDFLPLYLRGENAGFCDALHGCLVLPTWNHLWYLPYLFAYTLLLWGLLRLWPGAIDALASAALRALRGVGLLLVPIALLFVSRLLLARRFSATHALVDDWFLHLQYLGMFLFGAVVARGLPMMLRALAWRWPALVAALAGWAVLQFLAMSGEGQPWMRALAFSVLQWSALVAALGFAQRHADVDAPCRRTLAEAVFPLYLLHQTLIILLAHALLPWALPFEAEAPLLVAGTFALGWLGYRLALRSGPLRILFGLKPAAAVRDARRTVATHRA
ncbi:acyltransferase family protein [Rhizobacter sp. OV335]|uniref:acyltransferase family protein n=1 Tax=Rhizobacter sp. OV335 TaxID=1500264 RepID=UPI00091FA3B4|nr:acyltransferase family protein [Rhizobacter sp. OV335]SHM35045.1 Acyltransferase family protein [Rhizobacter sp. OV335]